MDAVFLLKGNSLKRTEPMRLQPSSCSFSPLQGLLQCCLPSPTFYVTARCAEYCKSNKSRIWNVSNRTLLEFLGIIWLFFLVQNSQNSQKQKGWSRTESNCHDCLIFLRLFKQEIKWTSMRISRRIKGCVISHHVGPLSLQSTAA